MSARRTSRRPSWSRSRGSEKQQLLLTIKHKCAGVRRCEPDGLAFACAYLRANVQAGGRRLQDKTVGDEGRGIVKNQLNRLPCLHAALVRTKGIAVHRDDRMLKIQIPLAIPPVV